MRKSPRRKRPRPNQPSNKPLSLRERGWCEGTSGVQAQSLVQDLRSALRPNPHPSADTLSRRERDASCECCASRGSPVITMRQAPLPQGEGCIVRVLCKPRQPSNHDATSPSPCGRGVGVRVRAECRVNHWCKTYAAHSARTLTRLPTPSSEGRGMHRVSVVQAVASPFALSYTAVTIKDV
jgi:hypothetical protein